MSYGDFTLETIQSKLGITYAREPCRLQIKPQIMPEPVRSMILEDLVLATSINTEKARSELIVMPLLKQVTRATKTSLFSGNRFDVDATQNLNGFIDFLISQGNNQMIIAAPILIVIEAKNHDLAAGYGQCIAEMVAAQIKNQNQAIVYGAVTTGESWIFLELENNHARIDTNVYYIKDIDFVYSILVTMCVQVKIS